jgi:hypothetical protein
MKLKVGEHARLTWLLSDRDRWCQYAEAQDVHRQPCHADDSLAIRWSLVGALWLATGGERFLRFCPTVAALALGKPMGKTAHEKLHGPLTRRQIDAHHIERIALTRLCNWEDDPHRRWSDVRAVVDGLQVWGAKKTKLEGVA